jgi:hypothetical protein
MKTASCEPSLTLGFRIRRYINMNQILVSLVKYVGTCIRVHYFWNDTLHYWVFGICPSSGMLKNTTFRKLDPFPSSGEGVGDTVGCVRNN